MNKTIFREKLKKHYHQLLSMPLLQGRNKDKRAPNIDSSLVLTDLKKTQPVTSILKDNLWKPLVVDGLKVIERILIEGTTGIGKTKFCYQYALSTMENASDSWVIVVPLRELRNMQVEINDITIFSKAAGLSSQIIKSISELMNSENSFVDDHGSLTRSKGSPSSKEVSQTLGVMREILFLETEEIYWVLDGADQIEDEILNNESVPGLSHWIRGVLERKHVLMTSCPKMSNLDFTPDRYIEIREFGEDSIKSYVESYFGKASEELQKFLTFLSQQKDMLGDLHHIPLILEILCWTWQLFFSRDTEAYKLRNLANLYKYVWGGAISLCFKGKKLSLELVENELEKIFDASIFYQFAYELPRGSQSFSGSDVFRYLKEKKLEDKFDEFINGLEKLAIIRMTSTSYIQEAKEYCFIHSTFQEYFAARHWVNRFLSKNNEKYKKVFRENKYHPDHKLMWVFSIGLLSENNAHINQLYAVYVSPPLDVIGVRHMQGLILFLRETLFIGNKKTSLSPFQERALEKVRRWFTCDAYSTLGVREFFLILSRHTLLKTHIGVEDNVSFSATFEEKKLKTIIDNLEHPLFSIRTTAIESIMALWEKLVTNLEEKKQVIEKLLARLLHEVDDEVKGKLAEALGSLGKTISEEEQQSALDYLITRFDDRNYFSRGRAAVAFGEILSAMKSLEARSKWIEILIQYLSANRSMENRTSAAQALGELGSEIPNVNRDQVITLIGERLDDQDDSYPRTAAAWALGRMKDILTEEQRISISVKLKALLEHDVDITCKARAAFALNQLGDGISEEKRAALIQSLIQQLSSSDRANHYFKGRIIWALSEMKNLIDVKDKNKLVELLLEYLCDDDAYVRDGVVEAFEHIPLSEEQKIDVIKKLHSLLLKTEDEKIKQSIIKLLTAFDQHSEAIVGDALPTILSEDFREENNILPTKPKNESLSYSTLCDLLSELESEISINSDISPQDIFSWLAKRKITWRDIVATLVMTPPRTTEEKERWEELMNALLNARDEYDIYLYRYSTSCAVRELFPDKKYDNETKWAITGAAITKEKSGRTEVALPFYVIKIYDSGLDPVNNPVNAAYWEIAVKAPGSRTPLSDIDTTISVRRMNDASSNSQMQNNAYRLKVKIIQHFHQKSRDECHGMGPGISRDSNVYSDGFMEQDAYGSYLHYAKFQNPKGSSVEEFQQFIGKSYKEFYSDAKKHKHLWEYAASLISLRAYFGGTVDGINAWNNFKLSVLNKTKTLAVNKNLIEAAKDDFSSVCEITEYLYRYQQIMLNEQEDENSYLNSMHDIYVDHLNQVASIQDKIFDQSKKLNSFLEKTYQAESSLRDKEKSLNKYYDLQNNYGKDFQSEIKSATTERDKLKIAFDDNIKKIKKILLKLSDLQVEKQATIIHANLFAHEAYINRSAPQHVVVGLQSGGDQRAAVQLLICSSLQQIGFLLLHSKLQKNSGMKEGEIAFRNAKYAKRLMGVLLGAEQGIMSDQEIEILSRNKRVSLFPALKTSDATVITADSLSQEVYDLLNAQMSISSIKENRKLQDYEKPNEAEKLLKLLRQKIKSGNTSLHEEKLFVELAASIVAFGYDIKIFRKKELWGSKVENQSKVKTCFFTLPVQHNLKNMPDAEKLQKFISAWDYASEDEILKTALSISRKEFMQTQGAIFKSKAMCYGFELVDVPGDGNCFFYALLDQLQIRFPEILEKLSRLFEKEVDHEDLRFFAVDRLIRMAENGYLAQIMPGINNYIENIARDRAWADGVIIDVIAAALDIRVVLINSDENLPTLINKDSANVVYLGYQVGVHFQSLRGEPNQLIAPESNILPHAKISLSVVPTLFQVSKIHDSVSKKRSAESSANSAERKKMKVG